MHSVLHDLITQAKIMVVRDIERDEIEFISKVGMLPCTFTRCFGSSCRSKSKGHRARACCCSCVHVGTDACMWLIPCAQTLGCLPIAHVDHMKPEKLGR